MTAPGSTIRIDARDKQACYLCHGSSDPHAPPAGASGENVQASLFDITGQERPASASSHPVRSTGDTFGLWCTSCHDPHADPAYAPGLLRATNATGQVVTEGNDFCWACHGTARNRRVDFLAPGYYTRSGGDKRGLFTGAHNGGLVAASNFESEPEFVRGVFVNTFIDADGSVRLDTGLEVLEKRDTPVITPTPARNPLGRATNRYVYDGDLETYVTWNAVQSGATVGNGWIGSATVVIDLEHLTHVESLTVARDSFPANGPDVIEIETSQDGDTWVPFASTGTLGVTRGLSDTLAGSADARYVRSTLTKQYTDGVGTMMLGEITMYGRPYAGVFEARLDIARDAAFTGGSLSWQGDTPAGTTLSVRTRASLNGGANWTDWAPATSGSDLTQISAGASLENALIDVRVDMASSDLGGSPSLRSLRASVARDQLPGPVPNWPEQDEPVTECSRCHAPHGSADPALVRDSAIACITCHEGPLGSTFYGAAEYSMSPHASLPCTDCHTSHGTRVGTSGTYAFLLPDVREEACFSCHSDIKDAFTSAGGPALEWGSHDISASVQSKTGSRMRCGSCHSPHSPSGLVDPYDRSTPFVTYRDDPTSIPTEEIVIYPSKDTVLDSVQPGWNYGAADTVTLTPDNRLLLHFDLTGIPDGVTIQHAALVLWTTTAPSGGYDVHPVTSSWFEGGGTGEPNSGVIDGATWDARRFGAQWNWTAPGGDIGPLAVRRASAAGNTSVDVTELVDALIEGPNEGIMITPYGATASFSTYLREYSVQQYRPKLRIVYQTGPATREIIDDVAFCLACHDGSMPYGLSAQPLYSIKLPYQNKPHGSARGLGIESRTHSSDRGGGGLRPPYSYGMDAIPCMTCHDPHGTSLPFHIKESVNGRDVSTTEEWGYRNINLRCNVPRVGWFCGACHIYPTNHNREGSTGSCQPCHGHFGSRG